MLLHVRLVVINTDRDAHLQRFLISQPHGSTGVLLHTLVGPGHGAGLLKPFRCRSGHYFDELSIVPPCDPNAFLVVHAIYADICV